MEKVNVLFLSCVPLYVRALQSLFCSDNKINFTAKQFCDFTCFRSELNNGHEVIIVDDSVINKLELPELARLVSAGKRKINFILFTSRVDKSYLNFFINNGIEFIIGKDEEPEIMREEILLAAKGERLLNLGVKELFEYKKTLSGGGFFPKLTWMEMKIIRLIGTGYTNKENCRNTFLDCKDDRML